MLPAQPPDPAAHHLTAVQAAEVAQRGGAARLILTHILESHDPGAALEAASQIFAGAVHLAEPGLVMSIGEQP